MHKVRLASIALAIAAAVLFYLGQPGRAVVLLGVAAAVAMMAPGRTLGRDTAAALHTPSMADATEALSLEGRGILSQGQLFVPARDLPADQAPAFDGHTRLAQRPPKVGLWITPPGHGLFEAWRQIGTTAKGLEGATATLKSALPTLELGDRVIVERGTHVRITYRPRLRLQDDASRPWHLQGADPVTSFIGMVLSHALGRPVRLMARDETEHGLRSEWET